MKNKLKKGAIYLRQIALFGVLIIFALNHITSQTPSNSSNDISFLGLAYVGAIIASIISIAVIFIPIELNKRKHKNHSAKNKIIITKKKKYNNRNKRY